MTIRSTHVAPLLAVFLLGACTGTNATSYEAELPAQAASTPQAVECPAERFDEFLPAFANRNDVRERFTRKPLETVVRSHRAGPDAKPDSEKPGMAVEPDADPRAHEVFAYRYDASLGRYEHVGTPLAPLQSEFKADPEWAFDFDRVEESPTRVEIAEGPESERKAFVFVRESDCWYFARAYDFGD